jgi:hypothetical protein
MAEDTLERFHTPDETAVIRGMSETGVKGKWDDIFNGEEVDDTVQHGRTTGGGEGAIDKFFTDSENADPELKYLYKEYLFETKNIHSDLETRPQYSPEENLKEGFLLWLGETDLSDDLKPRVGENKTSRYFDIQETDIEGDVNKLQALWNDPDAKIQYVYGKREVDDKITFSGEAGKVEITNSELQLNG